MKRKNSKKRKIRTISKGKKKNPLFDSIMSDVEDSMMDDGEMDGDSVEIESLEDLDLEEKPRKRSYKKRSNPILMVGNPMPEKKKKNTKKKNPSRNKSKKKKNPILMVGNPIPIIGDVFQGSFADAAAVIGGVALSLVSGPSLIKGAYNSIQQKSFQISPMSIAGAVGGASLLSYYFYKKNNDSVVPSRRRRRNPG